jgi:hypothetical protein
MAMLLPKEDSVEPYEVVMTEGGLSIPSSKVVVSNKDVANPAMLPDPPTERNCVGTPVAIPDKE